MIKVDGPTRAHTVLKPPPSLTAMYLSNPAVLASPSIMLQCESITPRLSTELNKKTFQRSVLKLNINTIIIVHAWLQINNRRRLYFKQIRDSSNCYARMF